MKRSLPFVAIAILIISSGVLLSWPLLAQDGRRAVLLAGSLVAGTQVPLHLLLGAWRASNDRFLKAVLIGFVSRLLLIVLGIVFWVIPGRVESVTFLVALGGFLVLTLFAESLLDQRHARPSGEASVV